MHIPIATAFGRCRVKVNAICGERTARRTCHRLGSRRSRTPAASGRRYAGISEAAFGARAATLVPPI